MKNKLTEETATFGAGCFWHIQEEFDKLNGIVKTEAGYMGGDENKYPNPTYEQVSSDKTGFVEVVQVAFNPDEINYNKLLDVFWKINNPTSLNRQGADIGTQYKSVIFYSNDKQRNLALKSKEKEQKNYEDLIVTEIKKARTFFPAENYHQKYLSKTCLIKLKEVK